VLLDPNFDDARAAQRAFRQLLDAMAWPGKINPLAPAGLAPPQPWSPSIAQIARTLLDAAVTFAVHGANAELMERYIAANCGARVAAAASAEYVLAGPPFVGLDVASLPGGTPTAPGDGATLIVACAQLSPGAEGRAGAEGSTQLMLRGRGVRETRGLIVDTATARLLQAVAAREDEYPLGLDVLLVGASHVAALPRTTTWRTKVPAWVT
jgi:alpha-D-ribose 1-methylphosphonate 5-triphosphate synthase subunit PhnH